MEFYTKRTVEEQALRLPEELRNAYKNSQIDRITIFDGTQELELMGYAEYSYLEEKSYKTQPVRTQDGAIQEIEEYATFLTPRLIIKYNMMGIEDYRSLMKMLKRRNGYAIRCYDVVEDKIVTNEMYVAPPSMPRIFHQFLTALGIQEHTIELIGTNTRTKILFGVSGTAFHAEFGQTWREFVDSPYNQNGAFVLAYTTTPNFIGVRFNSRTVREQDGSVVSADDCIMNGYSYTA